ncbi:MAG: YGL010W-like membrane protein [Lysobacterales bacterium]|jgi:uncharacterized membrane protein YGL010W
MRNINSLLDEYSESHRNLTNKTIHWIAVPLILWAIIALLWSIPFPFETGIESFPLNWATILLALAQVYWFRLSLSLGLGMLLLNTMLIQFIVLLPQLSSWPLWQIALLVFVGAWLLQFIGHAIEGKRPSFFKDLQFLLIGPAWLMAFIYRSLGIRI